MQQERERETDVVRYSERQRKGREKGQQEIERIRGEGGGEGEEMNIQRNGRHVNESRSKKYQKS